MEMTKYECERGHYFDVPCVDALSGTPHYTCPKCGSENCERVAFPGLVDRPITLTDEIAKEFVKWAFRPPGDIPSICDRVADHIEKQFEQRGDNETG